MNECPLQGRHFKKNVKFHKSTTFQGHSFVFKEVESKKAKLQLCICQVPSITRNTALLYFSYICYHSNGTLYTNPPIYVSFSPTPQKSQLTVSWSKSWNLRLCGQQLHGCIDTIQWSPYSPGNLLAAGRKGGEGAWCVVEGDDGDGDDDDDDDDDEDDDDDDGGISLSAFMWLCVSFCEVFAFQGDVGHPDVPDATASWLTTCFAVCVGWNLGPSRMNVWDKIRSCSTCVCVCRRKGVWTWVCWFSIAAPTLWYPQHLHVLLDAQSKWWYHSIGV